MAYQIGQIVYVKTPAAYGIVIDVLAKPKPVHRAGSPLDDENLWFKPGDIKVKLFNMRHYYYGLGSTTLETTYRLADDFFAKGIRVVDDIEAEIKTLNGLQAQNMTKNSDHVDLESAIRFLEARV